MGDVSVPPTTRTRQHPRNSRCSVGALRHSLLPSCVYHVMKDRLTALKPTTLLLQRAGGESLDVEGTCHQDSIFDRESLPIEVCVGKLESLDLLLGMGWLCTYGVELDYKARTIEVRFYESELGRMLSARSNDLVSLDRTVRIRCAHSTAGSPTHCLSRQRCRESKSSAMMAANLSR